MYIKLQFSYLPACEGFNDIDDYKAFFEYNLWKTSVKNI